MWTTMSTFLSVNCDPFKPGGQSFYNNVVVFIPRSAPIHMLPTRTLDQAHHCPKAAWDTPLPPNSRPSTPTRPTATETALAQTYTRQHFLTHTSS